MEIDNSEETVFRNNVFSIVKKHYTGGCFSWYTSSNVVPIVQTGDTRYWIYDNDGNPIGGDFCEKYGCKSFLNPTSDTVAVELSDNCWRVITSDKRCIPSEYQTLGDICYIGDFVDGYAEIHLINGISSYLSIDGDSFMKSLSGEYKRVPKGFFGGMFLSINVCVLSDEEHILHLYNGDLHPIMVDGYGSVSCKEITSTTLPWAVVLKDVDLIVILNTDTLNLSLFKLKGIESFSYKALNGDCLYLDWHTKNKVSGSYSWNNTYIENDHYSIVFYNGKNLESDERFLIDENKGIIITRQSKNNGCYSLKGSVILNNIYDDIQYDDSINCFAIKYGKEVFLADNNGRLFLGRDKNCVPLPRQVVAYEKISETVYKVAHYQTKLGLLPYQIGRMGQTDHGSLKYGLFDISQLRYIIPCRYSSLLYVSDSIIIVRGEDYGSWGIIDIYGGQRMPPLFFGIEQCADSSFRFKGTGGESFCTDSNLTIAVEAEEGTYRIPAYYTVQPFYGEQEYGTKKYNHRKFHRDYCVVSLEGKYGLLNKEGIEIISCINESVYCVYESEDELFIAAKYYGRTFVIEMLNDRRFTIDSESIDDCYKLSDGSLFFITSSTVQEDDYQYKLQGLYGLNKGRVFKNEYSRISPFGGWENDWLKTSPLSCYLELFKESLGCFALARYNGAIISDFVFKYGHLDKKNSLLICGANDSWDYENSHIAIFNVRGDCIVPLDANMEDYEVTPEGLIKACCKSEEFGYIFRIYNPDGELLTKQDYSYIGPFKDGEALINIGGNAFIAHNDFGDKRYGVRGGLFGVISSGFQPLIDPKYTIVRRNSDGLRVVSDKIDGQHLYGLVSFDGKSLIDCKYQYLGDAYKGQLLFAKNGRWTNSGSKREALYTADRRNRWLVDANWGIIDEEENILVPASFQYIYRPIDEVSVVVNNNKYGFYNYEQKMFFIPQYDFLEAFSEGVCVVGKVEKETGQMRYGYIDKTNHVVIPIQYLRAFHFKNGYANVETEDAYCTINMNNEIVRSQDKAELARWRAEEEEERARAIEEEEERRQMIEDGLREAFNGDMSNMWNID